MLGRGRSTARAASIHVKEVGDRAHHPDDGRAVLVSITRRGGPCSTSNAIDVRSLTAAILAEAFPEGDRERVTDAGAVIEARARPSADDRQGPEGQASSSIGSTARRPSVRATRSSA
jgi:hypothetical protein